jgi:hypothetical protein
MPYKVQEFQTTPNPNALKCVLDRVIREQSLDSGSWKDAASAQSDAVARAIFEIKGVNNLLVHGDWLTVGKEPGAEWKTIKKELARVLAALP